MASLNDRDYDNPAFLHKIHHFAEWNYDIIIM